MKLPISLKFSKTSSKVTFDKVILPDIDVSLFHDRVLKNFFTLTEDLVTRSRITQCRHHGVHNMCESSVDPSAEEVFPNLPFQTLLLSSTIGKKIENWWFCVNPSQVAICWVEFFSLSGKSKVNVFSRRTRVAAFFHPGYLSFPHDFKRIEVISLFGFKQRVSGHVLCQ